ncbi:MAG: hypothetical protein IT546_05520 [Caulobacteraceae bacterium]|nr:hypothetical protein [Caulobacteraceae bacterium]
MNNPFLAGRTVRVLGERLAPLARESLPGVVFEEGALGPCDLALIDADASPTEALAAIEALARQPEPPAALLIGAHLPTALVKSLMRLARSDVLESPFGAADLALAAAALMAQPAAAGALAAPPPPPQDSRCWAFVGTVGGCGATTLAIEAAAILAQRCKGRRKVCLVDLNLADGAAGAYLGATPNMRLAETTADRIDPAVLGAFSAHVEDDFDLFAAPRDPRAFQRVSPEAVVRMLDVACQAYDWVIVDVPRLRQSWTLDVLAGADEVVLVSELTVPALLSARAMAGEIEADLPEAPPPRIVLNRLNKKMFGPAPSLGEAERALQRKADGGVASDWEAASTSVNLGGPVCHHRPKSKLVKDVEALVDRLVEAPSQRAERPVEVGRPGAVRAA